MKKYDNLALGIGIGLVSAVLSISIYYLFKFSSTSFGLSDVIFYIFNRGNTFTPVLIFGGVNLAAFYYFLNRKIYNTARGILLLTFIMIIPIIIAKFVI